MQELQQRSPEAYARIAPVPEHLQQELGSMLLGLTHATLYKEIDTGFGVPKVETIPIAEHSPEQAEQHDRISGLMASVAETMSRAVSAPIEGEELAEQLQVHEVSDKVLDESINEVFNARERGVEVVSAIKNMLVVGILSRSGSLAKKRAIREIVAQGYTDELQAALGELEGVVSVQAYHTQDVGSTFYESRPLIMLATGTEYSDRFKPIGRLQDVENAKEATLDLYDGFSYGDAIVLAKLAEHHGNKELASSIAIDAVRKIGDTPHDTEGGEAIAKTLVIAQEICDQAGPELASERLNMVIDKLRAQRSVGHYHRYNTPLAASIDVAVVSLAREGRLDIAARLVSSSDKEFPEESPVSDKNCPLSRASQYLSRPLEGMEKETILGQLQGLHTERRQALIELLQTNGADETVIALITAETMDPDSAVNITPEFWSLLNRLSNDLQNDYYLPPEASSILDIIEKSNITDLSTVTSFIEKMAEAHIDLTELDTKFLRKLQILRTPEEQVLYLSGLAEAPAVLEQLIEIATNRLGFAPHEQKRHLLSHLGEHKDPMKILNLALKYYGDDVLEYLGRFSYIFVNNWSTSTECADITDQQTAVLDAVFGHSYNAEGILREPQLLGGIIERFTPEQYTELFNSVELSEARKGLSGILENLNFERVVVFSADPAKKLLEIEDAWNEDVTMVLQRLASWDRYNASIEAISILSSKTPDKEVVKIINFYSTPGIMELLESNSFTAGEIISSIRSHDHSIEWAKQMIQLTTDVEYIELLDFVGPENAKKLLSSIVKSDTPQKQFKEIAELYYVTDFIQERTRGVDFISHAKEWREFVALLPEGEDKKTVSERENFKKLVVARLTLDIKEDPVQAIRIFSELVVSSEQIKVLENGANRLISALYAAESTRGFAAPKANGKNLEQLFINHEQQEMYETLYSLKEAGSPEDVFRFMDKHGIKAEALEGRELGQLVTAIKEQCTIIREQDRASKNWIKQFSGQSIRAVKLIEAWKSRSIALRLGVRDNPNSILNFIAEKGVQLEFERMKEVGETTLTDDQFLRLNEVVSAVGARYAPSTVIRALERMASFDERNGQYPQKILGESVGIFNVNNAVYEASILSKGDPRGFTIGYDTGCCMTLQGASESCIWAGYEDPRYSFFTVYESGRLRAQSVMYVADQGDKKILVVDNIEANQGTDLFGMAELYRTALSKFIEEQGVEIDAIHVGEGYTDMNILKNFPVAVNAPQSPAIGVYTDARSQRVIWEKARSDEVAA